MLKSHLDKLIPGGLAIIAIVCFVGWIHSDRLLTHDFDLRVPGTEGRPEKDPNQPYVPLEVQLTTGPGTPSTTITADWICFRGENLDAICHDSVPLARQWPETGPPEIWSLDLGEGYAGAAVRDGRVYLLDYDQENKRDALRCLSLDDGREIWRSSYPMLIKRNHGMSRTVPYVTEKYCVAIAPKCQVLCVDTITGEFKWMIDMVEEYGTTVPEWYTGQCPLVDGDRVILAPSGSEASIVAVDINTGKEIWRAPNPMGWKMTHVSLTPMDVDGRRSYIYCGSGGALAAAADTGEILWSTPEWKISYATCPSPIILPGNRIFFSGGYNAGSLLVQIDINENGVWQPNIIRKFTPKEFGSTQQTPVLYEGHIYGIRERDKQFVCLDIDGNEVWASGRADRYGDGPYMIADGLIYILADDGMLTVAEATPQAWRKLDEHQVLDGHDAWGPLALVEGRMLLRDLTRMACIDVGKQ